MSLNYIGMIQYIGHGTKKTAFSWIAVVPIPQTGYNSKNGSVNFLENLLENIPICQGCCSHSSKPPKMNDVGQGQADEFRSSWMESKYCGEIACRNLPHTQSIAERGSFGNILCVICGKHATWTRIFYLVVNSVLANIVLLWHSIWNGSITQEIHTSHTQHIIPPFQVIGGVAF